MTVSEAEVLELARIPQPVMFDVLGLADPTIAEVEQLLPAEFAHLAGLLHSRLTTAPSVHADPSHDAAERPSAAESGTGKHAAESVPSPTSVTVSKTGYQPEPAQESDAHQEPSLQEQLAQLKKKGQAYRSIVNPADVLVADPGDFAPFDYSTSPRSNDPLPALSVQEREIDSGNIVQVTWPALPDSAGKIVLYRVLLGDHELDLSPEAGQLALVTTGLGFEEPVPNSSAFRHYQVWANVGSDLETCLSSQPRFIGEEIYISPVAGATIDESQGVVEGRWSGTPGCSEVRVYASPITRIEPADQRQFRLSEEIKDRYFVHRPLQRGITMRYALRPVVQFRGSQRVGPTTVYEQVISATLEKIDFEFCKPTQRNGEDQIEMDWYAPPAGTVRIYLTKSSPSPEISYTAEVPIEALERDPALASGQVYTEEAQPHGTEVCKTILWPNEWTEVHITPVTVIEGKAAVSKTQVLQRVAPIEHPELKERSDSQLVIFEWPKGADFVRVQTASLGETDPTRRSLVDEIDENRYREAGGVRLELQQNGQMVILTPLSRHSGKETVAPEAILNYPGLRRFHYQIATEPRGIFVSIWCDGFTVPNPPRFQLVQNPLRYPLSARDVNDEGAGALGVAHLDSAGNLEQPGIIITPQTLPNNKADAQADQWVVPSREIAKLQGVRYLRLFLLDDDNHDPAAPRKILTDEYNNVPRIVADAWRRQ